MTGEKHVDNGCYVEYKCPLCGIKYQESYAQATDYKCHVCSERMVSRDVHFCEDDRG